MTGNEYQKLASRTIGENMTVADQEFHGRGKRMNGYQLLANAIVQQAADDYFNILAGFNVSPPENVPGRTNKEVLEQFFHSEYYGLLTKVDPEYLMRKIKEKADSMVLIYTVGKEKGSSRYFVCRVGESTPLTQSYTTKKKALHKAAEMQDLNYKTYMKIRRRDGVDNAEN